MLRQGEPVESKRETLTGVQRFYDPESGQEYYYTLGPGYGDSGPGQERLSAEWRLERKIPGQQTGWGVSESYSPDTYEFSRDASIPTHVRSGGRWDGCQRILSISPTARTPGTRSRSTAP